MEPTVAGDSSATLYAIYTSQTNFTFTHADWLRWSELALPLSANATYAYSFARVATGSGWEKMSSVSGNTYTSGEAMWVPPSGGAMTLGSSHDYDGTFVIGLAAPGYPNVTPATFSRQPTPRRPRPAASSAARSRSRPRSTALCLSATNGRWTKVLG